MAGFIKSKAIFEIFLVITAIFFIGSFASAESDDDSAPSTPTQTCCEKTKSGESCVYTSKSSCNQNYKYSEKECSKTSFCETGCCFNKDGTCAGSAGKSACESKAGVFAKGISCDSISLCNKGCCTIGNSRFMATKQQCIDKSSIYPSMKTGFMPDITNEYDCINSAESAEKGCCIQGTECTYTEMTSCLGEESPSSSKEDQGSKTTGNAISVPGSQPDSDSAQSSSATSQQSSDYGNVIFESGKFCSKISICGCKPRHHKDCYNGDLYWFDSCSNIEEKAQDCDFSKGTLCSKKTLRCESLDCTTTFDKKAINGNDIVSYDGVPRKNGESWCEYDGAVGFGQDLVGSRHYRHLCISGEEFIEPCKDFREEYCMQANVILPNKQKIMTAGCKPNKWKECATACNTAKGKTESGQAALAMKKDKECCNDPKKSCFWSSAGESDIKKINDDTNKDIQDTCNAATDPLTGQNPLKNDPDSQCNKNNKVMDESTGMCLPLVPPGLKFWPDENEESKTKTSTAEAKKVCSIGDKTCTTYFYSNMMTGFKWIAENNQCMYPQYAVTSMSYCKAMGDCGIRHNLAGKFSDLAYECDTSDGSCKGEKHTYDYNLLDIDWEGELGDFDYYTKAQPLQLPDFDLGDYESFNVVPQELWLATASLVGTHFFIAGAFYIASLIIPLFAAKGAATATLGSIMAGKLLSGAKFLIGCWICLVIYLAIVIILTLIIMLTADTDKLDVNIYCNPWQAPYGSEDCEKCTNKDIMKKLNFDTCSEYKCKSLGQSCKWIPENEGSNRSSCMAVNVNDVTWPIITPWHQALTPGYSLTDFGTGYDISPELEGYELITFGILTNELSKCKYALEPNIRYNDMSSNFGDVYFDIKHKITLTALPNKENEIYIKCSDANGNANTIDYLIKFKAKEGKDLTPPMILESSIKDGTKIVSSNTLLTLKINEPAQCKYATQNIAYEQMEKNLVCTSFLEELPTSPAAKFKCDAVLDIKEGTNQYYFKCKDSSGNTNQESFMLTLTGSPKLLIASTSPSGELDANWVTLEATTAGGSNDGVSTCQYTLGSLIYKFNQTDSSSHSTVLPQLPIGSYSIPMLCQDEAGNAATAIISFSITRDTTPPSLMFIYKQGSTLIITMDEATTCEYSANEFTFGSGTKMEGTDKDHSLDIDKKKYYIICSDILNNIGKGFSVYP